MLESAFKSQAGTEYAPVLDRPAPLRRLHDSGAGYKYPDLLTYLRKNNFFVVKNHLSHTDSPFVVLTTPISRQTGGWASIFAVRYC